ncbi:MAG: SDR family NAD(P)-dependent oxidoreductase [Rhizobacter sp.]|nr:SDR family NAD(P)-dependent oxidoreductase [Rhizobacter sp.]
MQRTGSGGGGASVNVASINGLSGTPTASIYSATKHALIGLTRSVARDHQARDSHQHGLPRRHRHTVPASTAPRVVGSRTAGAAGAPGRGHSALPARPARRGRGGDCLAVLGRVLVRDRPCAGDRWRIDRMNPGT